MSFEQLQMNVTRRQVMAEADKDSKQADSEDGSNDKKSKKKLLIMIGLGISLVIGIGVAAALLLSGGGSSSNVEVSSKDNSAEVVAAEKPPLTEQATESTGVDAATTSPARPAEGATSDLGIDFGETYKMKTFHLNLGNALENRYVRLEVSLEYSGGAAHKQEIERRMPQLRDAVISVISRKTREFILAPDGKDALRKEVLIRINRYMKTKVDAVYITDILIE